MLDLNQDSVSIEHRDENVVSIPANIETLDLETQLIIAQLNEILASERSTEGISFKKVDRNKLNKITKRINDVIALIEQQHLAN